MAVWRTFNDDFCGQEYGQKKLLKIQNKQISKMRINSSLLYFHHYNFVFLHVENGWAHQRTPERFNNFQNVCFVDNLYFHIISIKLFEPQSLPFCRSLQCSFIYVQCLAFLSHQSAFQFNYYYTNSPKFFQNHSFPITSPLSISIFAIFFIFQPKIFLLEPFFSDILAVFSLEIQLITSFLRFSHSNGNKIQNVFTNICTELCFAPYFEKIKNEKKIAADSKQMICWLYFSFSILPPQPKCEKACNENVQNGPCFLLFQEMFFSSLFCQLGSDSNFIPIFMEFLKELVSSCKLGTKTPRQCFISEVKKSISILDNGKKFLKNLYIDHKTFPEKQKLNSIRRTFSKQNSKIITKQFFTITDISFNPILLKNFEYKFCYQSYSAQYSFFAQLYIKKQQNIESQASIMIQMISCSLFQRKLQLWFGFLDHILLVQPDFVVKNLLMLQYHSLEFELY